MFILRPTRHWRFTIAIYSYGAVRESVPPLLCYEVYILRDVNLHHKGLPQQCGISATLRGVIFVEYKRHIIMDVPYGDSQVQVYEYETNVVIWLGTSPEIYTPKEGKAIRGMIDTFIDSLLASGCKIVSDKCA